MKFENKRWIYLIAAMVIAVCAGIGYSWSVFQKPLIKMFGWSTGRTSLTFTIQVFVSTMSPMFIGKLQEKITTKYYIMIGAVLYGGGLILTGFVNSLIYLYIIFGVIVGLGIGMLYPCLMAYGVKLFPDKRGLVSGLLAGSYGAGSVIWAPTAARIMQNHSVLTVYKIFGVLFFIAIIILAVFLGEVPKNFRPEIKKTNAVSTVEDKTWKEMIKTKEFYLIVALLTMGTTSGLMIMGHASSILQEMQGFSPEKAAVLIGIISVFNACGRLAWGTLSDKAGRYKTMIIMFMLVGLSMIILSTAGGSLFIAALFVVGACYGGFAAMIAPVAADNFGIKNLSVNYGFLYIAYGFAGILGPQLAATAKDMGEGYGIAFITVAVFSAIGILLCLYLLMSKQKKKSSIIKTVQ
ncbi:OFA family MFS transporter [Clostridium sp. SYSU_GA19001]|uniref:L-lactate MFS transporter n=1 Tax=Clostridium caldaquaticum TaxID=2940653 RepID=UPI0020777750|nr:OFA family MFS transporter [Clostridium caldaquaticum]MCM8711248.1 OFA family MFS transporter [Clostridium caldaquaticum]